MKSGVLLDTGPLVAYLHPREPYHAWALDIFNYVDPPMITCEPVVAEACFLVSRAKMPAALVVEAVARGGLRIGIELQKEVTAVHALMQRYANVPMSLADACLVRMAELTGLPICTLDSDFAIYRAHGRRPLQLISPQRRQLHEP